MQSFRITRITAVAIVVLGPAVMLNAKPEDAQDLIKVGAPLPLTGPLSPEGLKQKRVYDLWADAANSKGGIRADGKTYRVEIVYADYASNTPRAVQSIERMITEDKVQFVFAPFGSGATKAASAVTEKYQIPLLAPSASAAEIFDQGFRYIFSTLTGNDTVSVPIAKLVAGKNKDIKRVAVLARNDLFPLAVAQEFEKAVKAEGLEVVLSVRHRRHGPFGCDHPNARVPAGLGVRVWLYQRPDAHPQADE
jgi:branched-chain amino acid transport system substrate-binding protein